MAALQVEPDEFEDGEETDEAADDEKEKDRREENKEKFKEVKSKGKNSEDRPDFKGHGPGEDEGERLETGSEASSKVMSSLNNKRPFNKLRVKRINYHSTLDVFLAFTQKVGIWNFNFKIAWPVGYLWLISWVKFPSIGWQLAFDLPALAARKWLYWVILVSGLLTPVVILLIVGFDNGKFDDGGPLQVGLDSRPSRWLLAPF